MIGKCVSADVYPFAYPISSHWVYALTFLHSALWIKARGRLVLKCCLVGLMESSSLSPCHYRLTLSSGSRFKLLPADISEHLLRIVALFLLRKRMDQRQYLLTHYDQRLHLSQGRFFPCFQVLVQLLHLIICRNHR